MQAQQLWQRDGFPPAILALMIGLAAWAGLLDAPRHWLYDQGLRRSAPAAESEVSVIAVDRASLESLGEWPWPRDRFADLIQGLHQAGANLVATTLLWHGEPYAPLRERFDRLLSFYEASGLVNRLYCGQAISKPFTDEVTVLGRHLRELGQALNPDQRLAASLEQAGNVLLGIYARPRAVEKSGPFPVHALPLESASRREGLILPEAVTVLPPRAELALASAGVGLIPAGLPDSDGLVRTLPLALAYEGRILPSLVLEILARRLNQNPEDWRLTRQGARLGERRIPTDERLQFRPRFSVRGFEVDSLASVLTGKIPLEKYRDRIVLLGMTDPIHAPAQHTPLAPMPPVMLLAHGVNSLLQHTEIRQPAWSAWLEFALFLGVLGYLARLSPHALRRGSALISLILLAGLSLVPLLLLTLSDLWLPLIAPAALLLAGHPLQGLRAHWREREASRQLSALDVENNRLLGLALQGQGRLEMAFDKFRQCPADELILGLLYNLGLDFERKRQNREALAVYRYMHEQQPEFRDIRQRMERLQGYQAPAPRLTAETLPTWFDDNGELHKPMLGRYLVEKKLGKGAMGVVYLGHDPRLNRVVALKTLNLSREFEGDDLQDATTRFFHEAAAAGRLRHPNVIAVYEAGEQDDLAYISMEYFKGGDLQPYTRRDNLLPLEILFNLAIKAAEALAYAHGQGVIHRDIKPANLMYNPATGEIKLSDFGIARIVDTQRTRTGIILGTPSYMAPEQLAGRRLDGRSDLFSLGVTLYQLLSGELPFKSESMASLMFKIASEPHPDIIGLRPELPSCVGELINRLLAKEAARRYANGTELAAALADCLERWRSVSQ